MDNNKSQENVIKYYVLCNQLKNIIRTGWKKWNVHKDRIESVAEHIFGVQSLAIAMYSEYEYDIDLSRVILMLAVHELEEIGIGDLTWWDISDTKKLDKGHEAVSKILSGLLKGDEIKQLVFEFDERKTKEAIFAYHCDKLECDIQCKLYDEEKCVYMNNQNNNPIYYDKKVQSIINSGEKTWSGMWLEFDRDKYNDDENFMEVLDYTKNHKISLDKKSF